MTSIDEPVAAKIRLYAKEAHALRESQMDIDASELSQQLGEVVRELQGRVDAQKAALEKLRDTQASAVPTAPSSDRRQRLKQLYILKNAYDKLVVPTLPPAGPIVPALVSAQSMKQTSSDVASSVHISASRLDEINERVIHEKSQLHDSNQLGTALEERLAKLRDTNDEQRLRTPTQLARDIIREKQVRKKHFDVESKNLQDALARVASEILAGMLAAEELGGPVVGDLMDVDDQVLGAGFSWQGRPKKPKSDQSNDGLKRQKRIDVIWGQVQDHVSSGQDRNEREAAAEELDDLITRLLDALLGDGEGTGHYVNLKRESAAARFLVRANIAQFHVKDASRLRLIDFGRELDN